MALSGTATRPKPVKRLDVGLILDQLDSEWATLKQDSEELHGEEAGLLAYFHTVLRCMLPLVGDPYAATFPDAYAATERLPKLCAYLVTLKDTEGQPLKEARERNVAALRACWPAYQELSNPEGRFPATHTQPPDVLPFTWAAIESGWVGEDDDLNRTKMLPTFATQASADFHLAALAVLFLNRQLRYYLTDLQPHRTGDGRDEV
ncbi:hypothetical protein [Deinococcus arenicola]|uniref:Uncharacterized protein n=1 Tax=Deinococcus arenicola TaxID=2994950 RepID=A0ABU4DV21_9DEIO|nr:hypothetical protein [Deinococcus sp. ZS9-10]MDV6376228.1 hypothetical protein [Deinococcus sp. ZS9-10]